MPSNYSGRSQVFDSPALRALGGIGFDQGELMSPMIRRKLLNTAALGQIEDVTRERQRNELHSAPDPVSGTIAWRDSDLDDYREDEAARSKFGRDTDFRSQIADYETPRANEREQDTLDTRMRGDVRRFYDPAATAMRGDEYARKLRLSTEPARIAAGGRYATQGLENQGDATVAGIKANTMTDADTLKAIAAFLQAGGAGRQRNGQPMGPSGPLAEQASGVVSNMLGNIGGGRDAGGGLTPQEQAFVQQAVQEGHSAEEATAFVMSKRAAGGRAGGPPR